MTIYDIVIQYFIYIFPAYKFEILVQVLINYFGMYFQGTIEKIHKYRYTFNQYKPLEKRGIKKVLVILSNYIQQCYFYYYSFLIFRCIKEIIMCIE